MLSVFSPKDSLVYQLLLIIHSTRTIVWKDWIANLQSYHLSSKIMQLVYIILDSANIQENDWLLLLFHFCFCRSQMYIFCYVFLCLWLGGNNYYSWGHFLQLLEKKVHAEKVVACDFFFFANIVLLHYLVKYNNISYIHDVLIILEFF